MLYIATTPVSKAATYNLAALAVVKEELGLKSYDTAQDAWLQKAIKQASSAIQSYCNRNFAVEAWQDLIYFDRGPQPGMMPGREPVIQLSGWPLVSVTSVTALTGPQTSTALTLGIDYAVKLDAGQLVKLSPAVGAIQPWRAPQVTVSFVAGFGGLAAQQITIGAATPVTVTNGAAFSFDQGVTSSAGTSLAPVSGAPAAGQYKVDPSTGAYSFSAADVGKTVTIAYAFNEIPDDVIDATLRLVTTRFTQKGRDPMLMERTQPNLGTQRWWVGSAPGQNGVLSPEIEALVSNYRVPVVA